MEKKANFKPENLIEKKLVLEMKFLDANFQLVGDPIELRVGEDGAVDVSHLPDQTIAHSWKTLGLPDENKHGRIYPQQGERFLRALLEKRSQNWLVGIKTV